MISLGHSVPIIMTEFMKTVLKTFHQNSGHVFGKSVRLSVHKYGHIVLRVLSTSCTLNILHTMPIQAFEVGANKSNEPHKAKLELKLII